MLRSELPRDKSAGDPVANLERRKLIKAAIASVPLVLTVTAGKARADEPSGNFSTIDSDLPSPAGDQELNAGGGEESLDSVDGEESLESDPYGAEKMETWGLESPGVPPTAEELRGM